MIRMELFSEVYAAFVYEEQENHRLPSYASIREILYWFVSDYADVAAEARVRELVCPGNNFAADIISMPMENTWGKMNWQWRNS